MPLDGKALGEQIVSSVREYVGKSWLAMAKRVDDLEAQLKVLPGPEKGEAGKDADPELVRQAVAAEVERAVAALPKPKDGEPGTKGMDADPALIAELVGAEVTKAVAAIPPAKNGEPGKDAEPVHQDTLALMVLYAVNKAVCALPRPENGKPGDPGRDALELEILPGIDEVKSYSRGTWASYKGGLWKAFAQTEGMRGWEVMVDGVSRAVVESADGRNFAVGVILASGKSIESDFYVPTMIYRGIWQEREYERGDTVTWAGSLFHCDAEKTSDKPETSTAWKLVAKRGRDGKDFDAPKPGPKQVTLR